MINDARVRMGKSLHALKEELATVRTGRASVSLLDQIRVPYYGSDMPLNQVAGLSVPEARTIVINPWEKSMIKEIEKAIMTSDLGLTPGNDGEVVRLNLPELTEDRRRDLVKQIRKLTEKSRVAIRNIRRDANDSVKRKIREKEMSEDQGATLQMQIQDLTDQYIKKIDELLDHKEKDILTV